jgi:predicted metal-binding membrane protein
VIVPSLARPATTPDAREALALALIVGLIGLALASGALFGASPLALYLTRAALVEAWAGHALFMLDWVTMCAAMMLPTAVPLVRAVARLAVGPGEAIRLAGAAALGFLGIWAAFGAGLRLLADLIAQTPALARPIEAHGALAFGLVLAACGAASLTPVALKCASACRAPRSFIATRWHGAPEGRMGASLAIGAAYGRSCFGCCWPQMLALSVIGMGNPALMLIAALAMLMQKQPRFGPLVQRVLALGLVLWGTLAMAGSLPVITDSWLWRTGAALCISGG